MSETGPLPAAISLASIHALDEPLRHRLGRPSVVPTFSNSHVFSVSMPGEGEIGLSSFPICAGKAKVKIDHLPSDVGGRRLPCRAILKESAVRLRPHTPRFRKADGQS